MSLAHNIRFFRKKQGWGQDILAEKLGYKSYTTIQKWESGVSEPPLKVVHALADLFQVSINDLTGTENDTPTDNVAGGLQDTNYGNLSPENRELIDAMIEKLLKSQSDD